MGKRVFFSKSVFLTVQDLLKNGTRKEGVKDDDDLLMFVSCDHFGHKAHI